MAACSSLLSEETFLCSVCLDVFTEPVSTPCGHNFCSGCIHKFWDSSDICQCPLCNRTFPTRPELQINTIMSELAAEFKTLAQVKASIPDSDVLKTADVPCDICSGLTEKAVKSCLMCLASFCKTHLEPHERVAGLKGHTLIEPVQNLDDKMCKMHSKLTELYCRTDQTCICVLCFKTDHKNHNVVPLEEEYDAAMAKKGDAMGNIHKMIQVRSEKTAEIEKSLDVSGRDAEKEKEATVQVFTDLIHFVERRQAELVEVTEERHRAAKEKGEGLIKELRMEVAELESRSTQLEQLSLSEDHHCFLQSLPTLCAPLNKDWADAAAHTDLSLEAVRGAVTLLKQKVDEITEAVPEIKMRRMREHAVDLTFDPDTAYCFFHISQDGKRVTKADEEQNRPDSSKRFEMCPEVLAKEGFASGKFYYEVEVTRENNWNLGVVRESVDRKNSTELGVSKGFWVIGTEDDGLCKAYTKHSPRIAQKDKIQKVGIFVDYDKGVVSFYDAELLSHMHSFTGCYFSERLYPYFSVEGKNSGANSSLIITAVPKNTELFSHE